MGRPASADDRRRELPRLPRGRHGPGDDAGLPRPGGALRHALHHRRRHEDRARPTSGGRTRSASATRSTRTRAVILAMGAEHKKLGVPGEDELAAAASPTAPPATPRSSGRATTIVVGGGDSAMEEAIFLAEVRRQGDDRAPPRRVPRLEDHARPRPRRPRTSSSSRPYVVESFEPARTARSATRRAARTPRTARRRSCRSTGAFVAIGHEPHSRARRGPARAGRRGLRAHRGQLDAHEAAGRVRRRRPRRPHLPPGRHRRGLRLPWPRSTPRGTCATPRSTRRPTGPGPASGSRSGRRSRAAGSVAHLDNWARRAALRARAHRAPRSEEELVARGDRRRGA